MVQLGAIAEYVYERPGDTLVNQATKFDLVWIEDAVALEDKAQARTTAPSRVRSLPPGRSL